MMCRMTQPTAGKLAFSARTHTPLDPHAGEFLIVASTFARASRLMGETVKPQAPTRWRRVWQPVRSVSQASSAATLGPTDTKNSLSSSGEDCGGTFPMDFPPATTPLMFRHTVCGPCSLIRVSMSVRVSRRMAERTARFRLRYSLESRPHVRRAPRRRAMRSLVAAVTGGADGFRILRDLMGACLSRTGRNNDKNVRHLESTVGESKTRSAKTFGRFH